MVAEALARAAGGWLAAGGGEECAADRELWYSLGASAAIALAVLACAPATRALGLCRRKGDDVWLGALDLESLVSSVPVAVLATASTVYGGATAHERWIGDADAPSNTFAPGADTCGCGAMGVCWLTNVLMVARALGTIPFYFIAEGGLFKKGEGRYLFVAHHLVVAFGLVAAMAMRRGRWYGAAMAVAEWSNPFVSAKQLLQRVPKRQLGLEAANGVLLALTFIGTRLVGIPLLAILFVADRKFALEEAKVPMGVYCAWFFSGIAMFGLSFYWAFPVLASAARKWRKAAAARAKGA